MAEEIFKLKFDAESFVKNIETAVTSVNDLDSSMKKLAKDTEGVNLNKPVTELQKLQKLLSAGGGADFSEFNKIFDNFDKNTPKIKAFLDTLKNELKKASDPQAVKTLGAIISQTEKAIEEASKKTTKFGVESETAEKKQTSFRAQIRANTVALQQMVLVGEENTEAYRKLSAETSDLIDAQSDLQGALKKASSDTYKVDLGLEGINTAIGAYQTYIGVLGLTGTETEELQESINKLLAVQQVAQGFQEISTFLTNKEGLALEAKTLWTNLSARSNIFLAETQGLATAAQQTFNKALLASGIGAAIVAIGLLIANWDKVEEALSGVSKTQKEYNDLQKESNKQAGEDIAQLKVLTTVAQSETLSKKERLKAVDELQKQYPNYFGNLSKEQILYGDLSKVINEVNLALVARARAQAIEGKIAEIEQKKLDGELKATIEIGKIRKLNGLSEADRALQQKATLGTLVNDRKKYNETENFFLDKLVKDKLASSKLEIDDDKKLVKSKKDTAKEIENVYKDRVADLKKQTETLRISELEGLDKINAEYSLKLKERNELTKKDLEEKKLSQYQYNDLLLKNEELNNSERLKAVREYNKQLAEERQKINDDILKLNQDYNKERLDLIQNDIQRETEISELTYKTEIEALEKSKAELIKQAKEKYKEDPQKEAEIIAQIENATYDLSLTAFQRKEDRKIEIAKKAFESQIQLIEDQASRLNTSEDRKAAEDILFEAERLKNREITFEQYKKNVENIQKTYNQRYLDNEIAKDEKELQSIQERYAQLIGVEGEQAQKSRDELLKQADVLGKDIAEKKTQIAEGIAKDKKSNLFALIFGVSNEEGKQIGEQFNNIILSTIDIIKQRNQAEIDSYDQAIKLQERRVSDATKIAENGNTEYLRIEEERLAQLEAKREAAAQRQLEIDAAVQASQILVAIAGAVAQIAQGGAVGVITGIATIAGAVATGFSLLNQLSAARPKFYDGTEYLQLGNNPKGKDTIPIMAHEGERIVPSYINEKLKGIKNEDLPKLLEMGGMPSFTVEKPRPSKVVAEKNELSDLKKEFKELKKISMMQVEAFKRFSVNFSVDEKGVHGLVTSVDYEKFKSKNA
jgi:hypothetical protein